MTALHHKTIWVFLIMDGLIASRFSSLFSRDDVKAGAVTGIMGIPLAFQVLRLDPPAGLSLRTQTSRTHEMPQIFQPSFRRGRIFASFFLFFNASNQWKTIKRHKRRGRGSLEGNVRCSLKAARRGSGPSERVACGSPKWDAANG